VTGPVPSVILAAAPLPRFPRYWPSSWRLAPSCSPSSAPPACPLTWRAAIGYLPYDGRFSQLNYRGRKTVAVVYLHTHPFLPGAIDFWGRQGFEIVDVEDDPAWCTTPMQRYL